MSHIFAYFEGKGGFYNSYLDETDFHNSFSGGTKYLNDHKSTHIKNSGAIPEGSYEIIKIENGLGYLKNEVEQGGDNDDDDVKVNEIREIFMIHTSEIPDHTSHGCIIIPKHMFLKLKVGDKIEVSHVMNSLPQNDASSDESEQSEESN